MSHPQLINSASGRFYDVVRRGSSLEIYTSAAISKNCFNLNKNYVST